MGKQVGFFMTPADELAFLSAVRAEHGPLVVIENTSLTEREIVTSLNPWTFSNANLSLVRPGDLGGVISTYVDSQGLFCVDLLNSKVVQFNRCRPINGWLAPGRLWFEEKTEQGKKSADFLAWANKLLSWLKKNYSRASDGSYRVGSEAERLSAEGALNLGPPREGLSPEEMRKALGLT